MAELKRGFSAGAVVGLIWSFVIIILGLIQNGVMSPFLYANDYLSFLAFLAQFAGNALIWGFFGLFFAALYNKLPKNQSYKLGIFSSILTALLIIMRFSYSVLLHINPMIFYPIGVFVISPVFFPVETLSSIIGLSSTRSILFFSEIIIYCIISILLLNYFWNKFGKK